MEAFNLPFRPGAGSSKEDPKKTSDFFTKSGKKKGRTKGTGGVTVGEKRKRSAEDGEGEAIDVDAQEKDAEDDDNEDEDDVQVLPTPATKRPKAPATPSPEWELSDEEPSIAKSAPRPAAPSPEWEMSDPEESSSSKTAAPATTTVVTTSGDIDTDKTAELQSNGMLSAAVPWKDPLGSDSDEAE